MVKMKKSCRTRTISWEFYGTLKENVHFFLSNSDLSKWSYASTQKGTHGKGKEPQIQVLWRVLEPKKNRSKISFNIMVAAPGIQDSQE